MEDICCTLPIWEYPKGYNEFLSEEYQKEDIYWEELFEDIEADYWIDYYKNNF